MFAEAQRTLVMWSKGVRFYIGIATILVTFEVWLWASSSYAGTSLFSIRLAEIYAWLATICLTIAVSIGPTFKVFKNLPGRRQFFDSRRLLGVSAAWFATIHTLIAYIALFKAPNPFSLPSAYQRSFAAGLVALIILLAMAFTSFDKAFKGMGVWWFRLHRFVYVAVGLTLLHAFLSGTHATYRPVVFVLGALTTFILGMHVYIGLTRRPFSKWQLAMVSLSAIALALIFNYGFKQGGIVRYR